MFKNNWSNWASMKQLLTVFTIFSASIASSTDTASHKSLQDPSTFPIEEVLGVGGLDIVKREAVSPAEGALSHPEISEGYASRDKKVPRGFMGMRGKKAPSGFLGLRGRRSEGETYSDEEGPSLNDIDSSNDEFTPRLGIPLQGSERVTHQLDLIKRAPSGFLGLRGKKAPSGFLGLRGKKVPSGFLGMRGKKAPSGFLGLRGKKAPSGFLGLRGKKGDEDYDELESVLQALRQRYRNTQIFGEEKRAPRGFMGLRGKKFQPDMEDDVTGDPEFPVREENGFQQYNDGSFYDSDETIMDKRGRSKFLGLRG